MLLQWYAISDRFELSLKVKQLFKLFVQRNTQNQRQLFVESHSDHIFNGFRAGIASGEMEQDAINIQFISLNEEHLSQAMKVKIGRMGRIENQQKDLFDQFDIDLNKMIGLPGRKNGVNT